MPSAIARKNRNAANYFFPLFFSLLCSVFSSLYLELFIECADPGLGTLAEALRNDPVSLVSLRVLALFIFFMAAYYALLKTRAFLHAVFKYRYPIALAALLACVVFELSGSSISLWTTALQSGNESGLLFGIPRPIRSDEWLVFTPMSISQEQSGFPAISHLMRGVATDTTMVYAQPSWSIATLFRPTLWGFLFLGASRGISFFWCGRLIALFMASFECARIFTNDNRRLSAAYAVLVTLSPITQWWFAINSIAELLIFGQLLVIGMHHYLNNNTPSAWAVIMPWLGGGFILSIYPAWQVPLFFVFLAMGASLFIDWIKAGKPPVRKTSKIILTISIGACICLVGIALFQALDTIKAVSSSVYPGGRLETGGGLAPIYFNYGSSILSAIDLSGALPNVCEQAAFYSLAPCGIIISLYLLARGSKDHLTVALLVVQALFLVYGFFGLPPFLTKVTLLSNAQTGRLVLGVGLVDLMLLVRGLSLLRNVPKAHVGTLFAICSGLSVFGTLTSGSASLGAKSIILACCALCALFLACEAVVFDRHKNPCSYFLVAAIAVVGVSGFCVNPIQRGITSVSESPQIRMIESIAEKEPESIWIADSSIDGQACIMAGASCMNSVNAYPNVALWSKVDPSGQYEDVYNRYAHITVEFTNTEQTRFELIHADAFKVILNIDDITQLGISKVFTRNNLEQLQTEHTHLDVIDGIGAYHVYSVTTSK